MDVTPFVPIGRVAKAHGLAGEVSVVLTGPPSLLSEGLRVWFVPPPEGVRDGVIESVRPGPKGPLVKIDSLNSPEAARSIAGLDVVARRVDLPAEALDMMGPDPVGLSVTDDVHGFLGEVEDVIVTGANDVWVVEGPLGQVLVPVIDDVMLDVDFEAGTALVHLLPGLLDEEA